MIRHTRSARHPRRLAALVAAAVLSAVVLPLSGTATAAPGAAPSANSNAGWLRVGHLSPGTGDADVRLIPVPSGKVISLDSVSYGTVSDFRRLPVGRYRIAFREAGAPMSTTPMVAKTVQVQAGSATTLLATGDKENVQPKVLVDNLTPPPSGLAKVRIVSGAANGGSVSATLSDGTAIAQNIDTGDATGYANVKAQTWSIKVNAGPDISATSRVPVQAGGVYSLLVVDSPDGGVQLKALLDSASARTLPKGGVDTGAGGLAVDQAADVASDSSSSALGLAGLAAVLLAGSAALSMRSRRTRLRIAATR